MGDDVAQRATIVGWRGRVARYLVAVLAVYVLLGAVVIGAYAVSQFADTIRKLGWTETSGEIVDAVTRSSLITGDAEGYVICHSGKEAYATKASGFTRGFLDSLFLNDDRSDEFVVYDAVRFYVDPNQPRYVTAGESDVFAAGQPVPNASFSSPAFIAVRAVLAFVVADITLGAGRYLWRWSRRFG